MVVLSRRSRFVIRPQAFGQTRRSLDLSGSFGPIRDLGVLLTALLPAAGCQPLPHPFADDVPRRGAPILALPDSTSVAIAPVEGLPRATAEKLGPAMASALQEREIAASDKTASIGSYELVGKIEEMPPSGDKAALVARS